MYTFINECFTIHCYSRFDIKLAKQKQCYRSADFWKSMYEQSHAIIQRSYEKSLNLQKIPGLLAINEVKPKELNKNKNMWVSNVYGSMEVQDILKLVQSIENEKKKKQKQTNIQQKDKERELSNSLKQNLSVVVFVQQMVFRNAQSVKE